MEFLSTRAIVLHRTPYNDRYAILHLYTRSAGRLGVLVPAGRRGRGARTPAFAPLSEVEITAEVRPRRALALLKEARVLHHHHRVQLEPTKRSQAIFISELLYRLLTFPEAEVDLYDYIADSITLLDALERGVANFYLCFCLHLLRHLAIAPGVIPGGEGLGACWFDLIDCALTTVPRRAGCALPPSEVPHLRLFMRMTFANLSAFRYSREQRAAVLDRLMLFYRLHLPSFPELKCLPVLRGERAEA